MLRENSSRDLRKCSWIEGESRGMLLPKDQILEKAFIATGPQQRKALHRCTEVGFDNQHKITPKEAVINYGFRYMQS